MMDDGWMDDGWMVASFFVKSEKWLLGARDWMGWTDLD